MYAVTSIPLESLTLAIFRRAEFGFLGVFVVTLVQTPRLKELPLGKAFLRLLIVLKTVSKAGVFDFFPLLFLFPLNNWLIVGIKFKKTKKQ